MNNLIKEYDHFIFDLDGTLWYGLDKYGNEIFAKQMLFPLHKKDNEDIIEDDVGSSIILRPDVKSYLKLLSENKKKISYLSKGAIKDSIWQPSEICLSLLEINDYFNFCTILKYKTFSKVEWLKLMGKCVYFNDNLEENETFKDIENVLVLNPNRWSDLL